MKKLSIFACAMVFIGLTFTACNDKGGDPQVEIPDGFYVVGPATTVDNIDVDPAVLSKALMGAGFNEAKKEKRDGMYEKYIALEANKEFSLVLRETNVQSEKGYDVTVYGANLAEKAAITDNAEIEVMMYWGTLKENVTMTVPKNGLYHIILDLNKLGDLTSTGGAQIAITPVDWGIRGSFIDADWTQSVMATSNTAFDKEHMSATWENVEVKVSGAFKFVSQDCWKIQLDQGGAVKAETSIGEANGEMTTLGESIDIPIARGVWTLVLDWDLKGGALGKSFSYKATKTAEIEVTDYSNCEMELVGTAVADQEGASPDPSAWGWGNVLPIGKPAKDGDVYTWKKENVKLTGGQKFKVRTPSFAPQGDIAAFDNGNDILVETDDDYTVIFILNAETGDKTVKLEGGAPVEPVLVTVKAKLPADWTNTPTAWVWPTGGDGVAATLVQQGDWWVYTTPEPVPALNIIFRNGPDWNGDSNQTVNIENLRTNMCYQIQEGAGKREVVDIDCE